MMAKNELLWPGNKFTSEGSNECSHPSVTLTSRRVKCCI